jgi:hypothetical protein
MIINLLGTWIPALLIALLSVLKLSAIRRLPRRSRSSDSDVIFDCSV